MINFFGILFAAIVVEGLVTYIKTIIVDRQIQWQIIVAMALGILTAITFEIDLFLIFGLSANIPFVGMVYTGILLSRGSNYIFDLLGKLTKAKHQADALQEEYMGGIFDDGK